jgi:hypothetical protein
VIVVVTPPVPKFAPPGSLYFLVKLFPKPFHLGYELRPGKLSCGNRLKGLVDSVPNSAVHVPEATIRKIEIRILEPFLYT